MNLIKLTIEEWDKLAADPVEYFKIKIALSEGIEVALEDECGIIYAYLKIDEIDKIKYVYKGFVD